MKLVSLTISRNSAWVIRATITHALRYCDSAVVLLHASTDETLSILRRFDERLTIAKLEDPQWNEMEHRQTTLNIGRELGGTHFVVIDDDEILTNNLRNKIRDWAEQIPPRACLHLPLLSCWRSLDRYRSDQGNTFSMAYKTVLFADAPGVNWQPKGKYQHHHTAPYGTEMLRWLRHDLGGYLHLQHANWDRLVTKQTWYMCMELSRWNKINADYRRTMDEEGLQTLPVPAEWWSKERNYIALAQPSWHAADIKRMVAERGARFFESYGVKVQPYV